jgi:hypothetical protein
VLIKARKQGSITNKEAKLAGGWAQSWYHLNLLSRAGLLKRTDFNTWKPTARRVSLRRI